MVFMRDGDGRWDAVDSFGIGLLQPLQELACVGRKALDIASLPLGIERVERQACLTAAADAAKRHQLVPGNIDVDLPQVMNADAAESDALLGQESLPFETDKPAS